MHSPSVQPNTPRLRTVRSERPVLFLKSPEEERIIWLVGPSDWKVSGPIPPKRECDVRERVFDLEVCMVLLGYKHRMSSHGYREARTILPCWTEVSRGLTWVGVWEAAYILSVYLGCGSRECHSARDEGAQHGPSSRWCAVKVVRRCFPIVCWFYSLAACEMEC